MNTCNFHLSLLPLILWNFLLNYPCEWSYIKSDIVGLWILVISCKKKYSTIQGDVEILEISSILVVQNKKVVVVFSLEFCREINKKMSSRNLWVVLLFIFIASPRKVSTIKFFNGPQLDNPHTKIDTHVRFRLVRVSCLRSMYIRRFHFVVLELTSWPTFPPSDSS